MLKVLWLCSWYPDKISPFNGDFIQRHAQAASLFNKIYVLKLTPDPHGTGVAAINNQSERFPNLFERRVYYSKKSSAIGKLVSYRKWFLLYKKEIRHYIEKNGLPDLVHVHIPFTCGWMALWIKKKYKIPYVVTEHWGGYNSIVKNNYSSRSSIFKATIRKSFSKAEGLHSVSEYLAKQINRLVCGVNHVVIPNVVDTDQFHFKVNDQERTKFRLVHISNGVPVKNAEGIMDVFSTLNPDTFSCCMIGLSKDREEMYQKKYPQIQFKGVMEYAQVAEEFCRADALIVFSFIENAPCVIGEALCCGVPVIATPVGGIPELMNHTNGIFVTPGDTKELFAAIQELKRNYHTFDRKQIAETAKEKFSYHTIGNAFSTWYYQIARPDGGDQLKKEC